MLPHQVICKVRVGQSNCTNADMLLLLDQHLLERHLQTIYLLSPIGLIDRSKSLCDSTAVPKLLSGKAVSFWRSKSTPSAGNNWRGLTLQNPFSHQTHNSICSITADGLMLKHDSGFLLPVCSWSHRQPTEFVRLRLSYAGSHNTAGKGNKV